MPPFTERMVCLVCKGTHLRTLFEADKETAMSFSMYPTPYPNPIFVPYNVLVCPDCKTYQTKFLGDLRLIYETNHVDAFGTVKKNMHTRFTDFITKAKDSTGILEIGPSTDVLANEILAATDHTIPYSVVDPDFRGDRTKIKVYDTFIEEVDLETVEGNTVVMSNLFEHLYHPMDVIDKIQRCPNNTYIYLNHPNFDHASTHDMNVILNIEHIFYVDNDFVIKMFNNFGYTCVDREDYETHTVLFKFKRTHAPHNLAIVNSRAERDITGYFERLRVKVHAINQILNSSPKVYMWPASSHTAILFTHGVEYKKMAGLLDNSPAKIGKFLYGYDLECFSFKETLASCDESTTIILGGSDCYLGELDVLHTRAKILYLHDL
jgi:hypothetical protein